MRLPPIQSRRAKRLKANNRHAESFPFAHPWDCILTTSSPNKPARIMLSRPTLIFSRNSEMNSRLSLDWLMPEWVRVLRIKLRLASLQGCLALGGPDFAMRFPLISLPLTTSVRRRVFPALHYQARARGDFLGLALVRLSQRIMCLPKFSPGFFSKVALTKFRGRCAD